MQQYPRAYVLSSLAVVLNVTAPATIILTAHEIVRIDRVVQATDPDNMTVSTAKSIKCIPSPPLMRPGPGMDAAFDIRGGGTPDHVPTLTVSYHDAA